ncbi:MAG: nucleotidyltransferase family protein [Eubacteriales bacterium]|nr:nucleotidyltransferase family protein [Eubacteriales bacterium]
MERYLDLIYLAAGLSTRFGSNKLLALVDGKPLYQHGLAILSDYQQRHPDQCQITVVTRFPEIIKSARAIGATVVENDQPEAGISHSIRLGLMAAGELSRARTDRRAAVFLVADQPWLKKETLAAFLDWARITPAGILTAGHAGIPGNPVSFDQTYFPELMKLEGDHGGRVISVRHPEDTAWYDIAAHEQTDIDHLERQDPS